MQSVKYGSKYYLAIDFNQCRF